jgi:hypothetical protein
LARNLHLWKMRVAVASGVTALLCLGGAPTAAAATAEALYEEPGTGVYNWSSYLDQVLVGFQSRRWDDVSYSEVRFTDCDTSALNPGSQESTEIELRWDRSLQPDRSWETRTYLRCFDGSNLTSAHEWHGLEAGNHFFQVHRINTRVDDSVSVDDVYVDTTSAD